MSFLSLRQVLYTKLKLSDDNFLFAELHQQGLLESGEAVVPNCQEADHLINQMEKNVVAFLSNHLMEEEMDEDFVQDLLKKSCNKELFHSTL